MENINVRCLTLCAFATMAAAILCGCGTSWDLNVKPSYPAFTTFELTTSPVAIADGDIVGVGGQITACDRKLKTVEIDGRILCYITAVDDTTCERLMEAYSSNIGAAVAIRGRIYRSVNAHYSYFLKPAAPSVLETTVIRKKLEAERAKRPSLRFEPYYGWRESRENFGK